MAGVLCCFCYRPIEGREVRQWVGLTWEQASFLDLPSPFAHPPCYRDAKDAGQVGEIEVEEPQQGALFAEWGAYAAEQTGTGETYAQRFR